jgi:hypothetical protein
MILFIRSGQIEHLEKCIKNFYTDLALNIFYYKKLIRATTLKEFCAQKWCIKIVYEPRCNIKCTGISIVLSAFDEVFEILSRFLKKFGLKGH